ncbi:hypothetical protein ACQ4PT_004845 [Festuca glaucescens]
MAFDRVAVSGSGMPAGKEDGEEEVQSAYGGAGLDALEETLPIRGFAGDSSSGTESTPLVINPPSGPIAGFRRSKHHLEKPTELKICVRPVAHRNPGRILRRDRRFSPVSPPCVSVEREVPVQNSYEAPSGFPLPFSGSRTLQVGSIDVPLSYLYTERELRVPRALPNLAWIKRSLLVSGNCSSSDLHPAPLSATYSRPPLRIEDQLLLSKLSSKMTDAQGRGRGRGFPRNPSGTNNSAIPSSSVWPQQQTIPQPVQPPYPQQLGFGFNFPPQWGFPNQFSGQYPTNQWVNPQSWQQANPPLPVQQQMQQQSQQFHGPNPVPPTQQQFPPLVSAPQQQQLNLQQPPMQTKSATTQPQGLSKNQIRNQKKAKAVAEAALKLKEKEVPKEKGCYVDDVCLNCGEPGHRKDSCTKPATCFICNSTVHKEESCPVRKNPPQTTRCFGSGYPDLEFYHVEIPDTNGPHFGVDNIGIVFIEAGDVSKEELAQEFSVIYKTN